MNAAVVVATYNERDNLAGLVHAILRHPGYRVIVVDDHSPDGTGQIADTLAAESPGRVTVIHRTGPRGLIISRRPGHWHARNPAAAFTMTTTASPAPRSPPP